jgi:hypothetical protein
MSAVPILTVQCHRNPRLELMIGNIHDISLACTQEAQAIECVTATRSCELPDV